MDSDEFRAWTATQPEGERWALVPEYPSYVVSSKGRIYSFHSKKILRVSNNYTHPGVNLVVSSGRPKRFHQLCVLVARAFQLPRTDDQTYVDHVDHDSTNNCVENLRYCTKKERARNAVPSLFQAPDMTTAVNWLDTREEKWARYPSSPHKYAISTYGRVYSIVKRRLCHPRHKVGQLQTDVVVTVNRGSVFVRQMMGITFPLPRLEHETRLYHLDGDHTNVCLSNLAWGVLSGRQKDSDWFPWQPTSDPDPFPAPHVSAWMWPVSATPVARYATYDLCPTMQDSRGNLVAYLGRFESEAQVQRVMARIQMVINDEQARHDPSSVYLRDFDMDTFHHDDNVSLY
jgi:hypothetical protein